MPRIASAVHGDAINLVSAHAEAAVELPVRQVANECERRRAAGGSVFVCALPGCDDPAIALHRDRICVAAALAAEACDDDAGASDDEPVGPDERPAATKGLVEFATH